MRIVIEPTRAIDTADVIRRSPVADVPWAKENLHWYLHRSIVSWAGYIDGEVACVWGLIAGSLMSKTAYLWLITTDTVDKNPFLFVRHSQMAVAEALKTFTHIRGHVVADNKKAIRWLKWLGVEFKAKDKGLIEFELRARNG